MRAAIKPDWYVTACLQAMSGVIGSNLEQWSADLSVLGCQLWGQAQQWCSRASRSCCKSSHSHQGCSKKLETFEGAAIAERAQ